MIVKETGKRGVSFTFEEKDFPSAGNVTVYVVRSSRRIFICDTHLGPASMEPIKKYISERFMSQDIIVFNSHSDWDHIWGNCAFDGSPIVAHEKCRMRMAERGEFDLERFREYCNGAVRIKLPDITFGSRLAFDDDGVEFVHTPGHTADSSIFFDLQDSVLFAGDLIEYPIPYLSCTNLMAYLNSLEYINSLSPRTIISAHSGAVGKKLIDDNIAYIKSVYFGSPVHMSGSETFEAVHSYNIKNLLLLKYEEIARKKLRENFDYKAFRKAFLNLSSIETDELENNLKSYVESL